MKKLVVLIFSCLIALCSNAQDHRPNVIIIYADDMGYGDLSSYGGEIPTPNIDDIGKQGIRFTDFYAQPVCTPSRYSLLTGCIPQRSKHNLNFALMPADKNYLDISETTIAVFLKKQNYQTALIGKWHLGLPDDSSTLAIYGFDNFTGLKGGCFDYFTHAYGKLGPDWYVNNQPRHEKGYSTDLITDHAIEFIQSATKKTAPFFLYLPYNAPHYGKTDTDSIVPYTLSLGEAKYKGNTDINTLQAPEKYLKRFSKIKDPYRRAYAAMVASLDDNIGRLMKALEKNKQLDNTLIWFISDNGGYSKSYHAHSSNGKLRGEKGQLWEGGIRVPAMVCWKGKIKPNQVMNEPLANIDVLPTILAMTGSVVPAKTDGIDISTLLLQNETLPLRNLYWQYNKQIALRRGDWKLMNGTELFNLKTDVAETINVANKFPDILVELKKELVKLEKNTGQ